MRFHFKGFKRHQIRKLVNSWFRFFDVTNRLKTTKSYHEHLFFLRIELRIVIWHIFWGDCSQSEKLSEIYALSFYRSQNIARTKTYLHIVAVTNILCQTKRWFAFSKINFCFWRGTKCSQILGLARKIWTGTKHFGTCKRTRH